MSVVVWRFGQKPVDRRKVSPYQFVAIIKNIGRLFIAFSTLEEEVEFVLKENLSDRFGKDELVFTVISKLSFSAKVSSAVSILGQKIDAIKKTKKNQAKLSRFRDKLIQIEKQIEEANSKRNMYAHARWHEFMSENYIRIQTKVKRDGVYHSYKKIYAKEMEKDINAINKTIGQISNLEIRLSESLR